jgi:hypothetical protein
MRQNEKFSCGIKAILPVQSQLKKYSDFPKRQINLYAPPSHPTEGRIMIVTNAGRDAVDADGATDEST